MRIAFASLFTLSVALLAACGPGRTTAATQPTPKTFEAAGSDAQAIAIVDQVIAASGGEAAWAKAKELHWIHAVIVDGKIVYLVKHDWDRWNGRHRMAKYLPGGAQNTVQHDLYEGTGHAFVVSPDGRQDPLTRDDINDMKKEGTTRLWADSYMLALPFKLKDPGVHLKYKGERAEPPATPDAPPPTTAKWDIIRVTFDPGVASTPEDIYELLINKETHLIDVVDKIKVEAGEEKVIGYKLEHRVDAGGLKFASGWINLGFKDSPMQQLELPPEWQGAVPPGTQVPVPGELVVMANIQVDDEPDDDLYVPIVSEPGRQ